MQQFSKTRSLYKSTENTESGSKPTEKPDPATDPQLWLAEGTAHTVRLFRSNRLRCGHFMLHAPILTAWMKQEQIKERQKKTANKYLYTYCMYMHWDKK